MNNKAQQTKINLTDEQERAFKHAVRAVEKNGKFFLAEAPTGWGKSIVLTKLAQYFALKGKKVIVATANNNLVYDLFNTFNKFFSHPKISSNIIIGQSN